MKNNASQNEYLTRMKLGEKPSKLIITEGVQLKLNRVDGSFVKKKRKRFLCHSIFSAPPEFQFCGEPTSTLTR